MHQASRFLVQFDTNIPPLEKCLSGCETNKKILCKHRIPGKDVIRIDGLGEYLRYYDFQIVRFFIYYIRHNFSYSRGKEFIILTGDHNFLEDAMGADRMIYKGGILKPRKYKKGRQPEISFDTSWDRRSITTQDGIKIKVKHIDLRSCKSDRGRLHMAFDHLNKL